MKTELRMGKHIFVQEALVAEIWYEGKFIGQVVGADGPGIRVLTKFPTQVVTSGADVAVQTIEVKILPPPGA